MSNSRGRSQPSVGLQRSDVYLHEKVVAQLDALRADFVALSKTKPDAPVNKLKADFVNEKLAEANRLVTGTHKPFEKFEQFGLDDLPSNSDVLVVVSQYLSCLEGWRSANVTKDVLGWYWNVDGERINAERPTRLTAEDPLDL